MRSLLALLCFLVFSSAVAKDQGLLQYRNDLTTQEKVRIRCAKLRRFQQISQNRWHLKPIQLEPPLPEPYLMETRFPIQALI